MSQVTVTGKIGPGNTITSKVFTNISSFFVNSAAAILELIQIDNPQRIFIDINAATVMTVTLVSSTNYTVVIS
jgi:hypothetical protein